MGRVGVDFDSRKSSVQQYETHHSENEEKVYEEVQGNSCGGNTRDKSREPAALSLL